MAYSALEQLQRIANDVSRPLAKDVDRKARFPSESFAALREKRLLAVAIPRQYGGFGCSVEEVSRMCTVLGQACASTACIFAMHQIQIMCIVRHGLQGHFFQEYLHEAAEEQYLVASATSEAGVGGDLRSSHAAVQSVGAGRIRLSKRCTAMSYCRQADSILVTARRAPDAGSGDQVLVLLRKQDYALEIGKEWDALGMRGTCTPSAGIDGQAGADQVLSEPFALIASMTMVPCSHIFWSAAWLGLAMDAVSIARRLLMQEAGVNPGKSPLGARCLAEGVNRLEMLRACVHHAAGEYQQLCSTPEGNDSLFSLSYAIRCNDLKIASSELLMFVCHKSLQAVGLRAYANDSAHSLARHVRDALGASLMIANERISISNESLLLVDEDI